MSRTSGAKNRSKHGELDFAALCRRKSQRAMETIIELMEDPSSPPSVRHAAATTVIERAYGKAKQQIDAKVEHSISGAAEALEKAKARLIVYEHKALIDNSL